MSLRGLTFEVPGARIALNGSYALSNEALDFRGTLRMKATVSQAVGGFKSIFIKPFDALFRKDGIGCRRAHQNSRAREQRRSSGSKWGRSSRGPQAPGPAAALARFRFEPPFFLQALQLDHRVIGEPHRGGDRAMAGHARRSACASAGRRGDRPDGPAGAVRSSMTCIASRAFMSMTKRTR